LVASGAQLLCGTQQPVNAARVGPLLRLVPGVDEGLLGDHVLDQVPDRDERSNSTSLRAWSRSVTMSTVRAHPSPATHPEFIMPKLRATNKTRESPGVAPFDLDEDCNVNETKGTVREKRQRTVSAVRFPWFEHLRP
jgi:hypothetical protein